MTECLATVAPDRERAIVALMQARDEIHYLLNAGFFTEGNPAQLPDCKERLLASVLAVQRARYEMKKVTSKGGSNEES